MKNQEGQVPFELATAEDVKCLLQDAMTSQQSDDLPCLNTNNNENHSLSSLNKTEIVTLPTGASMALPVPIPQVCLSIKIQIFK